MNFIVSLIKLSQPINILEIGTAIGYSALSMHYGLPNAHITTLERNEDMFNEATKNFAKYSLNDKIDLIKGDALETLPNLIKENKTYDFIFIDAAKGQYRSEERRVGKECEHWWVAKIQHKMMEDGYTQSLSH